MADYTDDELAQAGLEQVLRSLENGRLPNFTLWKPAALQRFDRMFVNGELSQDWFEDFRATLRVKFGWELRVAERCEWPDYADTPPGLFAVLELDRHDGAAERMVVRPQGQIIEVLPALSLAL